jgi:hypothetical protein
MKILKKFFIEMTLPFILSWFLMTILVDMVAVPTIFRNSSNIIDAGKIGMIIFGRFNSFEIFFALMVFIGSVINYKVLKNTKWLFFSLPLFLLVISYKFYMTPMITETTYEIHKTLISDPMYVVLQSRHAEFHNLYRLLDSIKLFVLLFFGSVVLFDRLKSNKEIL